VVTVLITERVLINPMVVVTAAMVTVLITERVLIKPMVVVTAAMVTVLILERVLINPTVLVIITQSPLPVVSLLNQPVLLLLGLRHKRYATRKILPCAIEWIFAQTVGTTRNHKYCMIDADSFCLSSWSFSLPTKGTLTTPIGGQRSADVWVATSGAYNEWVSVGNFDSGNRMCRTHLGMLLRLYTSIIICYCCY
jgi:hypothetical protein